VKAAELAKPGEERTGGFRLYRLVHRVQRAESGEATAGTSQE
jgi:hypothetical protein